MGELGVLFNPGMRHEQEEKLAKQMLREDEGTGRKGRRGIDLESGVVVIGADDTPELEPSSSEIETTAVNGDISDSADGTSATAGIASIAAAGSSAGIESAAKSAPATGPGEPRVARHASTSIPSGKARRHASTVADGTATAARPVGKSQRRSR